MATETQSTLATVKKSSRVLVGDCRELLRDLPDECIDAIVTDPPYELGFMGKRWDASGIAYDVNVWREALRVLKPGGHLLAFGGTRTYHRMACAIEDAGFEVRDSIHWIYGSGFPKSLNVSKAIDKAAGAERQVTGWKKSGGGRTTAPNPMDRENGRCATHEPITAPATNAAKAWRGWGTALKPAHEPIVVARKPLVGTVAANVLEHGTGALNIDGTRIQSEPRIITNYPSIGQQGAMSRPGTGLGHVGQQYQQRVATEGRWPPNVLLSHSLECGDECAEDCAVAEMDRQSEGASRFFPCFRYQAKASRPDRGEGNTHPTVKPTELMQWLVRLVTPPNGVVLDPFTGSGTTGVACVHEGFDFIGCELSDEYASIARARIERG